MEEVPKNHGAIIETLINHIYRMKAICLFRKGIVLAFLSVISMEGALFAQNETSQEVKNAVQQRLSSFKSGEGLNRFNNYSTKGKSVEEVADDVLSNGTGENPFYLKMLSRLQKGEIISDQEWKSFSPEQQVQLTKAAIAVKEESKKKSNELLQHAPKVINNLSSQLSQDLKVDASEIKKVINIERLKNKNYSVDTMLDDLETVYSQATDGVLWENTNVDSLRVRLAETQKTILEDGRQLNEERDKIIMLQGILDKLNSSCTQCRIEINSAKP